MKKAMILAAGRGERMGLLTARTPKPLLRVGGRFLIEYAISGIRQAGINEIIINISYQGHLIKNALGDGAQYGVKIIYSEEAERLETGGGIFQALPYLGKEPFLVVSSDVVTDFPLSALPPQPEGLAHLVMVANPFYHPEGDFGLHEGKIDLHTGPALTFANIGIYRPELFAGCSAGHFRLAAVLKPAIMAGKVTGEYYQGAWHNIGTPDDLAQLEEAGSKSVLP
ncbi:D-glycero-alpha-D-manno-heptose 1-phosphate guanylyltransferase [Aquicella siphonis]|uniref:D-glycero-alpha-D-manno-heptose 1-phosphate guanylyltransferase n=1 Tax=Aquicella siphonis TaxID=254247 RepID=A0A5E4PFE7_9COXI|nr:nucleotidyltransferase family protein [Aquicella siphonis]VVC75056.1 D-glycero-alpha-D-manno-heptose 1-phosphate guanylyltransferase [Aquicella siphonis]